MTNILVAQSGGPTAAINATLAGVVQEAKKNKDISYIYGAFHGVQGILEEELINLGEAIENEQQIDLLSRTPAAALGSCRLKLKNAAEDDSQYSAIIEIFRKYEIHYFVYIGGNDSMDTVYQLSEYCKKNGIDDIWIVGAPKTIDNDLCGIDHCPGFGSAAKYITTVFAELEREIEVYDVENVIIVELMGRNAGWLTAAAALSEGQNSDIPYLIYLEEHIFEKEKFLEDVKRKLKESKYVMVAVSEGIHDKEGNYVSEGNQSSREKDAFGHQQLAGTGRILEQIVREQIGCKVRSIELNLLQRCASHCMSATDIEESKKLGACAVNLVIGKETGKMSGLVRVSNEPYQVEYISIPIAQVANKERKVPKEWISEEGNGVTEEMISYLKPLIQGEVTCKYENGIPKFFVLNQRDVK